MSRVLYMSPGIVNRVKELRIDRGWAQEQLAQTVGVSTQLQRTANKDFSHCISARSLLVGGVPGVIRVEVGHRRCQVRCFCAEILLIYDVVLVNDECHYTGVAVFGRVGEKRNAATKFAVHQVTA